MNKQQKNIKKRLFLYNFKKNIIVFLKGMLMGACDVVPGVSGGTIAFITGIYDRLIDAIASFKPKLIKLFRQKQIKQARTHIDGAFLLSLFSGIIIAILSLAKIVKFGLEHYPSQIYSFFIGLILASLVVLFKKISFTKKNIGQIFFIIFIGCLIGFFGTNFPLLKTEPTLLTTFFSGAIAIIAMILPGISGSYILLMLNHYHHLLDIITNIGYGSNIQFLFVFLLGAFVGILSFAKLLNFIKKKYPNKLYSFLTGIMIGSLQMLWPWKETIKFYMNSKGQQLPLMQTKILPTDFMEVFISLLLILIGFFIVIFIERLGKRL